MDKPVWLTGAQAGPTAQASFHRSAHCPKAGTSHPFSRIALEIPAELHTMQMLAIPEKKPSKYLNGFSHLLKVGKQQRKELKKTGGILDLVREDRKLNRNGAG